MLSFKKKSINVSVFGCAGSLLLCGLLSSCGVWAYFGGFSCRLTGSGHLGGRNCGPWAQLLELLALSTDSILECTALVALQPVGIFPDQGSNLCFLHQQVDSLPLSHWGNPQRFLKSKVSFL